jgi:hypothetical protein
MEVAKRDSVVDYRLLYLQPDPEAGERVCVGVVFSDDLLFDSTFAKVRCLSKEWSADLLRVYLDEIKNQVQSPRSDFELAIKRFAPLFSASAPRQLEAPATNQRKLALYQTFVASKPASDAAAVRRAAFVTHVRDFVISEVHSSLTVIANATGREVLGKTRVPVREVALAIKGRVQTVLLDGVDLNIDSAKIALRHAGRVNHTFWQYRIQAEKYHKNIKRIALVFNGHSHLRPDLKDAHDYALHQFQKEADHTEDASKDGAQERLQKFLAEQLG